MSLCHTDSVFISGIRSARVPKLWLPCSVPSFPSSPSTAMTTGNIPCSSLSLFHRATYALTTTYKAYSLQLRFVCMISCAVPEPKPGNSWQTLNDTLLLLYFERVHHALSCHSPKGTICKHLDTCTFWQLNLECWYLETSALVICAMFLWRSPLE